MCASSLPVTLNKREAFVSIIEEEIIEERVKRQQQRQTNKQRLVSMRYSMVIGSNSYVSGPSLPASFPPFLEKTTLDAARIQN